MIQVFLKKKIGPENIPFPALSGGGQTRSLLPDEKLYYIHVSRVQAIFLMIVGVITIPLLGIGLLIFWMGIDLWISGSVASDLKTQGGIPL